MLTYPFFQVQLQESERRWEEVQSYIRKRTAEHEAAQQGKGRGIHINLVYSPGLIFLPSLYVKKV